MLRIMSDPPPYRERYRPQLHFTARRNWLNDPNGCVYHDGEWHLFFQHNPTGLEWGNMSWGHAASPDLLHWTQLPDAIRPYDEGTIFSGSAVVDHRNTSGLGTAGRPPLVAVYTHARKPSGQAMAYSMDRGRTWSLFENGRHVVANQGLDECERDPKVFWHEPSARWIMVLWVQRGRVRFFGSKDLRAWAPLSDFAGPGFYECPDLVAVPVTGEAGATRWVLYDAALQYWIGDFDGITFRAESGPVNGEYGSSFYAAQSWSNTGRRVVQIAWMRGGQYPDMPFNQQMSFPCDLGLHRTARGLRLTRAPVPEIESLVLDRQERSGVDASAPAGLSMTAPAAPLDLRLELEGVGPETSFSLEVSGQRVTYDGERIGCLDRWAPLAPADGALDLRLLVDRASIELFANRGEVSLSSCFLGSEASSELRLNVTRGSLRVRSIAVCRLSSIWQVDQQRR